MLLIKTSGLSLKEKTHIICFLTFEIAHIIRIYPTLILGFKMLNIIYRTFTSGKQPLHYLMLYKAHKKQRNTSTYKHSITQTGESYICLYLAAYI